MLFYIQLFDGNEIAPQEGTEHGQQQQLNPFFYNEILVGNPNLEEEIGEEEERGKVRKSSGGKKKYKETFENVRCLKCAQWVKGRGICLLYHMNTRSVWLCATGAILLGFCIINVAFLGVKK